MGEEFSITYLYFYEPMCADLVIDLPKWLAYLFS